MDKCERPEHPNGRCIMIKIKAIDMPEHDPFVIGGRYKTNTEILRVLTPPIKVLFWRN